MFKSYKKGGPHRDSFFILIVAEGEREEEYFHQFVQKSKRYQLVVVSKDSYSQVNSSSPKYFIDRLESHIIERNLPIAENDQIWFVHDLDRLPSDAEHIHELLSYNHPKATVNCGLSNPMFEVWLLYHYKSEIPAYTQKAELKTLLGSVIPGGYNPNHAVDRVSDAITHAETNFSAEGYFPNRNCTNLFELAKHLLK